MKAKKGLWAFILLLTMFLAACGTSDSTEPDMGNGSSDGVVEDEVTALLEQMDNDLYRYTVSNQTDETITFEFTSGQRYDFTITNEEGEELYRLSSVSTYIQVLGEETLEPGDKLEYEIEIPPKDFESGTYTITAWLTPQEGKKYEAEAEFTVE
ncbi:hypothetical protein BB776_05275 [Planococcus salinarum]|uniref:Intracellular proteinase inhibitor BsuPI domain-containing protein n=1 Tax=Planococcus salinarum TaxID=622695 RepID=A0ABX3D278_9BACL|nr:BsuPI-related putative proteinase inhibitor [Planococcus salinarum]OHX56142.1 hypothetical protein BB776_05275 [Planococcus salinarum]TAA69748.1 intracellular proteinase inhibitor (BsuPI) [Planococcus salinarum]